jgi:hypothetical protein
MTEERRSAYLSRAAAKARKYRAAWTPEKKSTETAKKMKWRAEYNKTNPRFALAISRSVCLKRRKTNNPVSIDDLVQIWTDQGGLCALSGLRMTWGRGKIEPTSISLDRIDCDLAYEKGNVRLVCHHVNAFRGRMSDAEMLAMAKAIVAHMEPPPVAPMPSPADIPTWWPHTAYTNESDALPH